MFGGQAWLLVLKLCLLLVLVIMTLNNSKLAGANNELAEMKISTDTSGFISIDCGASGDYIDNATGLFYESDAKYIDTGEIHETSPNFSQGCYQQQIKYLRSFPQGTRNCYTLQPKQGANSNYLIRAIFAYGNYDSKNMFPVFDLYLGVNKLASVSRSAYYEIIHVPSVEYVDVCLVNIGYGVPFISVLELRPLDNSIYRILDGALCTIGRYGGVSNLTRYPVDVYDRLWAPLNFSGLDNWNLISTQSTVYNQSFDDGYKVPAEVLKTAARAQNARTSLSLSFTLPYSTKYYVYFHFAEIENLNYSQNRELRIELNGERNPTESIRLEYLKPITIAPNDTPISGTGLHFSIYAADGSDLPPILNAFEAFAFASFSVSPTNRNDEIKKHEYYENRELSIELNGERNFAESITLEYLQPKTVGPTDPPINCTPLNFSIYAVDGSDFPPILNAFQLVVFVEFPLSPTNIYDVNAIKDIKQKYNVARNWEGDPCVPDNLSWDGLNCSHHTTPRIIALNLSSSNLNGVIGSSLSSLEAITVLDLSYNNLNGPIPEFLAKLPNLKVLNLSWNNFTGSVPDALVQKSKNGTLLLRLEENPDLVENRPDNSASTSASHRKKRKFFIPFLAATTVVLLILGSFSTMLVFRQKRRIKNLKMAAGTKREGSLKSKNRLFTYSEIVSITKNFEAVIGEGGFGKVYHGILIDDTEVAVKVLSPSSRQGYKEFQAEAQLLMILHHKNLVSLIGYCDDQQIKALIYEFMKNGNLRKMLLPETDRGSLSWTVRLQIAIDAAHGLDYLHNSCKPHIIHRDLKLSNILLDETMQAKIADFGLSRFVQKESGPHSTDPAGTPGYIDPILWEKCILSRKIDVYSFGIVLFELITGNPGIMGCLESDTYNILSWVTPIIENGDIQNIVDPRLQGQYNSNAAQKFVETAMSCVKIATVERPDISLVLTELKACLAIEEDFVRTCRIESCNTISSNILEEATYESGNQMVPNTS